MSLRQAKPGNDRHSSGPSAVPEPRLASEQEHTEYACQTCRQRKIKCDRLSPCSNCIRNKTKCIQANYSGRRKRNSTKALYRCLHSYQRLLTKHRVAHKDLASFDERDDAGDEDEIESILVDEPVDAAGDQQGNRDKTEESSKFESDVKDDKSENFGDRPVQPGSTFPSSFREAMTVNFDDFVYNDESLLFGPRRTRVALGFHPPASQIFRLWHVYLDRVDPLLKITHTPTFQTQILDGISNLSNSTLDPILEALLYAIYAVAVFSLKDQECQAMFGMPQSQLLSKYQYCSQQALMNAGFMRTNNRMCLVAFFLYLVSMRFIAEASSLWSMSGLAIRIAQRIGIDNESTLQSFGAFEAEMGRRLWWALVAFEHQISTQAGTSQIVLNATWSCEPIQALNDWELRPEMGDLPPVQDKSSEALFSIARSEVENYAHSKGGKVQDVRTRLEERVFRYCNTVDPLHLMTAWWTRGAIAKTALSQLTTGFQKAGFEHACEVLETDALLMGTASTSKFLWFCISNSPLPAYIYLLRSTVADFDRSRFNRAWSLMYENHILRRETTCGQGHLRIFTDLILSGWADIREGWGKAGQILETPKLVLMLQSTPIS